VVGLPLTFATQALIPRLLGPATYGDFSFLSAFFLQVVAFLDGGLSSALYSKVSQRPQESALLRFFWGVTVTLTLLVVVVVLLAFVVGADRWLWPGQQAMFVWAAAGWGLLTWYSQVLNKLTDAYGLTVASEAVRLAQKVVGFLLVVAMWVAGTGGLAWFFGYHYALAAVLCVGWWLVMRRRSHRVFAAKALSGREWRTYGREFFTYTSPLVVFQIVSLFAGLADRWLLQHFAGSVQQGFFGLSYQIGALCFLVTGAMVPLFWREIAREHEAGNRDGMRRMFERQVPLLYTVAAFFSVFVALQADKVSLLIGGAEFRGAAWPIAIMALYPIHQTYGQLNAAFFMGTGETRAYRNIGLIGTPIQFALTFGLIAPAAWLGLGLGALGLALAMVIAQFISVNMQLRFISRYLGVSFVRLLVHQVSGVVVLTGIGAAAMIGVDQVVASPLVALLLSGGLYLTCVLAIVWVWPSTVSRTRSDLMSLVSRVR